MAIFLRAAWGARPPLRTSPPLAAEPYGVVHDIGGGNPYPSSVVATLQQIQANEQHNGYVDIAYNWGVDRDGNEWELRGDVSDGATLGYAGRSFSVLAICNASAPNFIATPQLIAGLASCLRNARTRGVLAADAYIDGHHWFDTHETSAPTACPGSLMAQIPQIRALVTPAPIPVPQPSEDEMVVKVLSPTWKPGQSWRGAIFDLSAKTITQVGVHLTPNLPPQKMSPPNVNDWFDAKPTPIGVTLFTSDHDPYDYTMTDLSA